MTGFRPSHPVRGRAARRSIAQTAGLARPTKFRPTGAAATATAHCRVGVFSQPWPRLIRRRCPGGAARSELARDGTAAQAATLSGLSSPQPFIASQLGICQGPVVADTDYVRAVPESIRAIVPAERRYLTFGTDGFGRSDSRAALRAHFGVDAPHIAQAARYCAGWWLMGE